MMRLAIISLLALVLTASLAASPAGAARPRQAVLPTCRIMPLGDSITQGHGSGLYPTDNAYMTGYRLPLASLLQAHGYRFDFVGRYTSGQASGLSFDYQYEGQSGQTLQALSKQVFNRVTAHPPDIILLHIGTNGAQANPDATLIETVLAEIDRYDPAIPVVLARILNRPHYSANITAYNTRLAAIAAERQAAGDRIVVVDMEDALDYTSDFFDYAHPNEAGYAKMAEVWLEALSDLIPSCRRYLFLPMLDRSAMRFR